MGAIYFNLTWPKVLVILGALAVVAWLLAPDQVGGIIDGAQAAISGVSG